MANIKIRYFAWVKHKIGKAEEDVTLPEGILTIDDLRIYLKSLSPSHHDALKEHSVLRVACDHEFADMGDCLGNTREVAFFPPVTGG